MYNWSTDVGELKKDPKKYTIWKLEQMVNFGLNGEKLSKVDLKNNRWLLIFFILRAARPLPSGTCIIGIPKTLIFFLIKKWMHNPYCLFSRKFNSRQGLLPLIFSKVLTVNYFFFIIRTK